MQSISTNTPSGESSMSAMKSANLKDNSIVGEYLSFTLGKESYGVDILKVQEIRGYDAVTKIPDTPSYIKGVINLRGTIVPIIDLRIKLNLLESDYNSFTVMIVLNVGDRVVGIVVDSVSDVIPLTQEQIRPTPTFDATVDIRFIEGIGTVNDWMLILINIEALLNNTDIDCSKFAELNIANG